MPSLGPAEILVILVIALLVFGPEKMPEIARQVGKGMREFKRVQQHLRSELRDVVAEFDAPSATESRGSDPLPTFPPKDDVVAPDAALAPSPDPISPEVMNPEVMIPDPVEPEPLSPPPPDLAPADPPPPTDAMNGNGNGTAPNPGTADSGTPAEPA
jgi:sec-independent protein translocase protein TatA